MKNLTVSLFIGLFSFSAVSAVSLEDKADKLKYLELLSTKAPAMNIDAYRREFNYEKQGLSLEARAHNEALLMAEQIKTQLAQAYEVTVKEAGSHEAAVSELSSAVENDLALAAYRQSISLNRELYFVAIFKVDLAGVRRCK